MSNPIDSTLGAVLREKARTFPDRDFLVWPPGKPYSSTMISKVFAFHARLSCWRDSVPRVALLLALKRTEGAARGKDVLRTS